MSTLSQAITRATAGTAWLPYQRAWIADDSPCAIWEKSRRIGADYCEAYRAVSQRMTGRRLVDYWYSSADESAALEFAEYVKSWLALYNAAYELVEDRPLVDGRDTLKMSFRLPEIDGRRPRITVMTSSPKRFRSKGGDVCLSELAFHERAREMWKAAAPVGTWGGQIRIISSHNGERSVFNTLLGQARKHTDPATHGEPRGTDLRASVHRTDIYGAVEQGLCERINAVSGAGKTRERFIDDLRAMCATQEVWDEEYCCIPSGQGGSYFPHALLAPCVDRRSPVPTAELDTFMAQVRRGAADCDRVSAGCDIGRVSDRFVVWVWGRDGARRRAIGVLVWRGEPFDRMEHAINTLMHKPMMLRGGLLLRVSRLCIDATGMGMQIAERMGGRHRARVEGVTMTAAAKEDAFTRLRAGVEELTVGLPDDPVTLSDFSAVRKEVTASGNVRYSAVANEHGHADRATAAALGLVADESARSFMRSVEVEEGCML